MFPTPEPMVDERPGGMMPMPMKEPQPAAAPDAQVIERQLEALLRKAKQIADANGLDFSAIVSRLERSKEGATPTAPPMPPSQPSPFSKA